MVGQICPPPGRNRVNKGDLVDWMDSMDSMDWMDLMDWMNLTNRQIDKSTNGQINKVSKLQRDKETSHFTLLRDKNLNSIIMDFFFCKKKIYIYIFFKVLKNCSFELRNLMKMFIV